MSAECDPHQVMITEICHFEVLVTIGIEWKDIEWTRNGPGLDLDLD